MTRACSDARTLGVEKCGRYAVVLVHLLLLFFCCSCDCYCRRCCLCCGAVAAFVMLPADNVYACPERWVLVLVVDRRTKQLRWLGGFLKWGHPEIIQVINHLCESTNHFWGFPYLEKHPFIEVWQFSAEDDRRPDQSACEQWAGATPFSDGWLSAWPQLSPYTNLSSVIIWCHVSCSWWVLICLELSRNCTNRVCKPITWKALSPLGFRVSAILGNDSLLLQRTRFVRAFGANA